MGPSAASFGPYGPPPGPMFFNGPDPSMNPSYLPYNGPPATSWQSAPSTSWTGRPSNIFYGPPQSAPYIHNEMFNPNFNGGYDPYFDGPWGPNYGINSSMIDPSTLTPGERHWMGFPEDPSASNTTGVNTPINNNTINSQVTNTNTNTTTATNGPSPIRIPGWTPDNPWTKGSTVPGALQEHCEHLLSTKLPEEKKALTELYDEGHQEETNNWTVGSELWKKIRATVDSITGRFTKPDNVEETIEIKKSSFLPFVEDVYDIGGAIVDQREISNAKHQSHIKLEKKNAQMLKMNNLIRSLISNERTEFPVRLGRSINELWGPQYKTDESGEEIQSPFGLYFHSRYQRSEPTDMWSTHTTEPQEPILPTPTTSLGGTTGGPSNLTSGGGNITDDLFSGLRRNRFGLSGNLTSPFSNLSQGLSGLTSGVNSLFGGTNGTGISVEDLLQINREATVLSNQTGLSLAEARQCILQNGTDLFEEDVPMFGNGFSADRLYNLINRDGAW